MCVNFETSEFWTKGSKTFVSQPQKFDTSVRNTMIIGFLDGKPAQGKPGLGDIEGESEQIQKGIELAI